MDARLATLQSSVKPNQAILLSQPSDITIFAGFNCLVTSEREAFLLIRTDDVTLIHSSFSPTSTVFADITLKTGSFPSQLVGHIEESSKVSPIKTLFIDADDLKFEEYRWIKEKCSLEIEPMQKEQIWQLRAAKNELEQQSIAKACEITSQAVTAVISQLRVGMTEKEVRSLLFLNMLQLGADANLAFPTIVAFGPNSALPHHQPTSKILEENMAVLIDVGGRVNGFCADMTRTVWFGPTPSAEFLSIESIVMAAYNAALSGVKTTIAEKKQLAAKTIDAWAREVITRAGFGQQFIHTTGHGLGLDIHEPPSLNWRNEALVATNTVITIEPGIYLQEKFGYRFENTVLITDTDAIELSK